jgi:glycosyltransferase involved in cell wall biosynthesis
MKELTIIMPFLNEKEEPKLTINSIMDTVNPQHVEIFAIDDGSKEVTPIPIRNEVKYIRNRERIGVNACIQMGIEKSQTPYVLIIDAHMRFPKGWFTTLMDCITREPETAWCMSCMQLGYGNMDLSKATVEYTGASLLLVDQHAPKGRPAREILEPKWMKKKDEMEYEIPCILGANYFFSKKWLDHIRGTEGLTMWGTEEPFLSLKTWMSGGKCKITRRIRIGHQFRDFAPYSTQIWSMVYNKIYLCKTILPEQLGNKLIGYMPQNNNFKMAMNEINKKKELIKTRRDYYQSIFKVGIEEICKKFSIWMP